MYSVVNPPHSAAGSRKGDARLHASIACRRPFGQASRTSPTGTLVLGGSDRTPGIWARILGQVAGPARVPRQHARVIRPGVCQPPWRGGADRLPPRHRGGPRRRLRAGPRSRFRRLVPGDRYQAGSAICGLRAPADPLGVVGWYVAALVCLTAIGVALGSLVPPVDRRTPSGIWSSSP